MADPAMILPVPEFPENCDRLYDLCDIALANNSKMT
ncbi:hypothetical protein HOE425_320302 [Hoeflea sp. EC-HK425]|nr:hypothetical protein HOE425_320302 [Hoeflea sp. EC-HK425]